MISLTEVMTGLGLVSASCAQRKSYALIFCCFASESYLLYHGLAFDGIFKATQQ